MAEFCALGHKSKAMECPACCEASSVINEKMPLEHWRWYRGRTSSKRIKALVSEEIGRRLGEERGEE